MPIYRDGIQGRMVRDAALEQYARLVNLHPTGHWKPWPLAVENPAPTKHKLTWAAPNNVVKKIRMYGAEVVTPEVGMKTYGIPPEECDKGANCCRRLGLILMRYDRIRWAARMAANSLETERQLGTDVDQYFAEMDKSGVKTEVRGYHGVTKRSMKRQDGDATLKDLERRLKRQHEAMLAHEMNKAGRRLAEESGIGITDGDQTPIGPTSTEEEVE